MDKLLDEPSFGTKNIVYVELKEDALDVVTCLMSRPVKVIGVALEGDKLGPLAELSLVQLATEEGFAFVFDVLTCPEILTDKLILNRIFRNSKIMKVIHNSSLFYASIYTMDCFYLNKVFDLQCAYAMVRSRKSGVSPYVIRPINIETLCEHYTDLDPGSPASYVVYAHRSRPLYNHGWLTRPLPSSLLGLAAAHAACLVPETYKYFLSMISRRERKIFWEICDMQRTFFLNPEEFVRLRADLEGRLFELRASPPNSKKVPDPSECLPFVCASRSSKDTSMPTVQNNCDEKDEVPMETEECCHIHEDRKSRPAVPTENRNEIDTDCTADLDEGSVDSDSTDSGSVCTQITRLLTPPHVDLENNTVTKKRKCAHNRCTVEDPSSSESIGLFPGGTTGSRCVPPSVTSSEETVIEMPFHPNGEAVPHFHPNGEAVPHFHPNGEAVPHFHPNGDAVPHFHPNGEAVPHFHPNGEAVPHFHPNGEAVPHFHPNGEAVPHFHPNGDAVPHFHPNGEAVPHFHTNGEAVPHFNPNGEAVPHFHPNGEAVPHFHPNGEAVPHFHPNGEAVPHFHPNGEAVPHFHPHGDAVAHFHPNGDAVAPFHPNDDAVVHFHPNCDAVAHGRCESNHETNCNNETLQLAPLQECVHWVGYGKDYFKLPCLSNVANSFRNLTQIKCDCPVCKFSRNMSCE